MAGKRRPSSRRKKAAHSDGSMATALEKVAEVGAALPMHPVRAWQSAQEGTQELAGALPEVKGVQQVKEFIRRHPGVSTCAALFVGYYLFGSSLPLLGRVVRFIRR